MAKRKLFKKIPGTERKGLSIQIRVNEEQKQALKDMAGVRHMTLSDYLLTVGMGRRTDVTFAANIIVELRGCVMILRDMHATMLKNGLPPPEEEWRPVIQEIREIMKNDLPLL